MVKLNWSSYTIDLSVNIFLEDFYKAKNYIKIKKRKEIFSVQGSPIDFALHCLPTEGLHPFETYGDLRSPLKKEFKKSTEIFSVQGSPIDFALHLCQTTRPTTLYACSRSSKLGIPDSLNWGFRIP